MQRSVTSQLFACTTIAFNCGMGNLKDTRQGGRDRNGGGGDKWCEFSFMARAVMKALFMANSGVITVGVSLFAG